MSLTVNRGTAGVFTQRGFGSPVSSWGSQTEVDEFALLAKAAKEVRKLQCVGGFRLQNRKKAKPARPLAHAGQWALSGFKILEVSGTENIFDMDDLVDEDVQAHLDFLREQSTGLSPSITTVTASLAEKVWFNLSKLIGRSLPVPSAATGPDGQVLYSWSVGKDHLEIEILPTGSAEVFYRNRISGENWLTEYLIDRQDIPAKATDRLQQIFS
jgi:hypothetical protein